VSDVQQSPAYAAKAAPHGDTTYHPYWWGLHKRSSESSQVLGPGMTCWLPDSPVRELLRTGLRFWDKNSLPSVVRPVLSTKAMTALGRERQSLGLPPLWRGKSSPQGYERCERTLALGPKSVARGTKVWVPSVARKSSLGPANAPRSGSAKCSTDSCAYLSTSSLVSKVRQDKRSNIATDDVALADTWKRYPLCCGKGRRHSYHHPKAGGCSVASQYGFSLRLKAFA